MSAGAISARAAALRAVVRMEWRSAVRDRRALLSALVFPLLGPVLVGVMFTGLARTYASDGAPTLTVRGAEHAPGLMAWLRGQGLELQTAPADADLQVRDGRLDVLVDVPADFAARFRAGRPATVHLVADFARPKSAAERRRARHLLQAYSSGLASTRLLARGVHPSVVTPLAVDEVDLATPQQHSANLLNVVPLFVIMACFIGGMQVAIDATAGERERGSVEALLLNPIPRADIAAGKWVVTVAFSLISALLTLVLSVVSMNLAPLEELGVQGGLGAAQVALIAALVLPLAPLASAAQLFVGTFARSFKEAQTWLSLLLFVPMIPGFVMNVAPIQPKLWMYAVPALSQQLLVTSALRGEVPGPLAAALGVVGCLLLAALALWGTGRMLQREQIIFSGQ